MFPYRPKMPMFGTKLARKIYDNEQESRGTTASSSSSFTPAAKKEQRVRHLMHGGPVQRAVKADLLLLRSQFYQDYMREMQKLQIINNGMDSDTMEFCHACHGGAFRIYKNTFEEAKFAIIHTRCCPPRCERDSFIQLVYETVLDLLRDACESVKDVDKNGGDNFVNASHDDSINSDGGAFFHAIFAIFSLYTIYETNPMPSIPIIDEQNHAATGESKDHDEKMKKELLSTLSLGLNSDECGKRVYRRSYRSPIRIDMPHFSLLYQLRQWASCKMDDCQFQLVKELEKRNATEGEKMASDHGDGGVDSISSDDDDDSIPMNDRHHDKDASKSSRKWQCRCGLAGDCIYIIDRLRSNASFQLCEYPGPVSLEGLAGSKDYYHNVVLKQDNDATSNTNSNHPVKLGDLLHHRDVMQGSAERRCNDSSDDESNDNSRKCSDNKTDDDWDNSKFISLQSHQLKYDKALRDVASKFALNNVQDRPSRKLKLVQTKMLPILHKRKLHRSDEYIDAIRQLETIFKKDANARTGYGMTQEEADTSMLQPLAQCEEKTETFATIPNVSPATANFDNASESSERRRELISQTNQLQLKCPVEFDDGLKLGIELALKNVKSAPEREDATITISQHRRAVPNDWLVEMEDVQDNFGNICAQHGRADEKNLDEEEMDLSLSGDVTTSSLHGLNALDHLLSRVSRKRKPKTKSPVEDGENGYSDGDDNYHESDDESLISYHSAINSLATERGRQALDILLSTVSRTKSQPIRKRRKRSSHGTELLQEDTNDKKKADDDIISMSSGISSVGMGQRRLETLLSLASRKNDASKRTWKKRVDAQRSKSKSLAVTRGSAKEEGNQTSDDDDSASMSTIANSIPGNGHQALQVLLRAANKKAKTNEKMLPPRPRNSGRSGTTKQSQTFQQNGHIDDTSIVSGCEHGQDSLQKLLQKASVIRNKKIPKRQKASREGKRSTPLRSLGAKRRDGENSDSDGASSVDQSIATTGPAGNALDALLARVKK